MTVDNDTPGINRRRVLQGAAWATPAVVLAVAAPAAANSVDQQIPDPTITEAGFALVSGTVASNSQYRTLGWTPLNDSDLSHANQNWGMAGANEAGFLCMDDNTSYSQPAVMQARYSFPAAIGVTYAITYNMYTGWGSNDARVSARQSVVVSIQQGAGAPVAVDRVTVGHGGTYPEGGSTDAQMSADGYEVRAPTPTPRNKVVLVTATQSGTIYINLDFTIEPLSAGTVSDDILISQPVAAIQN